ncbi:N-acetylmannosamine-6-phosphate 2-epimerase [Dictyoglomus sp.]|jgi:N-acylglucosamine-6-phosphate 2-epimerase|uniref:N-acetylmannosamine-6-phosphate 2-epimerase n=1 Tax=Dictyoglomus sp. TaxID=28205 RepID=UPI003CACE6F9
MKKEELLLKLKNGIIVSCQAQPGDPTFGNDCILAFAKAAFIGGASGLRLNGPEDIKKIKKEVPLPIIGIYKDRDLDSEVYITPTSKHFEEVLKAGADIIAVDATKRKHIEAENGAEYIKFLRKIFPEVIIMADISDYEEGILAWKASADLLSTTLSGYTPYTKGKKLPDFKLVKELAKVVDIPVILEGGVWTPEDVKYAFQCGAYAVVIGTAITRPHIITKRFVMATKNIEEIYNEE